jgi:glycerophosphoryl diester phosphodiesterase
MLTLAELLEMTVAARAAGVPVTLTIETKHPNPRALDVEDRVAEMLAEVGWDAAGSPIRLITFSMAALERMRQLLPALPRTLLVEDDLDPWRSGVLPEGVAVVAPDLQLLREDPGFVQRARAQGNEVHVWTVNHPDDIRFCRDLGVTGFTSDYPELVAEALAEALAGAPLAEEVALAVAPTPEAPVRVGVAPTADVPVLVAV